MRFIIHESLGEASQIGTKGIMLDKMNARVQNSSLNAQADAPVRAGRPTREQAEARQLALLERALDLFLEKGYEATTIEAIAADVNMTKRTVYARYPDKGSLFRAALRYGTERIAVTPDIIEATRSNDLEETLVAVAMLRISLVADRRGENLQRLINTEAYRFPDIFQTYYNIAALPTVRFLAEILRSHTQAGQLAVDDPMLASTVFMSMVVSGPVRFMLSGNALSETEIDERVRFSVRLFLKGAEPR